MNQPPEPHGRVDTALDDYEYDDDGFGETLPVRPKRPFLTKWSAALMALVLGAGGFFVGVRVEKGKIPSTSGASAFAGTLSAAGRGATSSRTGAAGGFAGRFAGGAGGAGGAAGFAGAGSNDTIGSVASVNGKTIYVTETSGDTVKVKLSGQTTITKSESVSSSKVFPGDEVVIAGTKGSGGTITATSLTDSGARASSSTTSGSTSGGSSSAVSSLFGS